MLRITLPSANSSEAFILEGRLTGLWAGSSFASREGQIRDTTTSSICRKSFTSIPLAKTLCDCSVDAGRSSSPSQPTGRTSAIG